MSRGGPLFARAQPPSPGSLGRFRVEFHFGGIGPLSRKRTGYWRRRRRLTA
ncbi:MAG: hypothetical protein VCF24_19185 [Candidatus Latescibacterota bacterium]